jgi:L-threonylcarbamoyladenylate synthase
MDREFFEREVESALKALEAGKVILYPTDTIWGLGCDATNEKAVEEIYKIKKRPGSKSMIVLVAEERDILKYIAAPDPAVFDFMAAQAKPTTVIFDHAIGLAENLLAEDGSVAIRIVQDDFCRHLIKRLRRPVVSTSANVSGEAPPRFYSEISKEILDAADHVVKWRQEDENAALPSRIIRWLGSGKFDVIRD